MKSNPKSETVLITGASSGIGQHLAREFARHGHPLVIVAPVESELKEVGQSLENEFGVTVQAIAKDLTDEGAAEELFNEVGSTQIEILANNAGLGQRGRFWENPPERDIEMIRLNVEAV